MDTLEALPGDLISDIHAYYHDLQYFVGALTQLSIVKGSQEKDTAFLRSRLEDINGFAIIMSAKTNFLKYLTLQSNDFNNAEIQVHKVLFRIMKGARQIAKSNRRLVRVTLSGESFASIFGPDIFEFIPYLIMENAVKYSPNHGHIHVEAYDHPKTIDWSIDSLGPELQEGEIERIFEKGFRGANAKRYTNIGAGVGLYHVKLAIEKFYGGSIRASQRNDGSAVLVDGIPFRHTRFAISMPRA